MSVLGGDGSDMAFLASECKSGRIMFGGRSTSGDALLNSIFTLVSGPSCGKNPARLSGGWSSIIIFYIIQLSARVWPCILVYRIHMTFPQSAIRDINDIRQWSYLFNNDSWHPDRSRAKVLSHHR